ncbi:RINT-1 / TIP-1 family domain-containing protein [Ditylenchus destructor]|uniref:WD repeat-containing protein 79 n=1 Tax=Ditylenchus destructor TaxID=166010 RepID=A0AAD4NBZ1_9BILA|nr:RINT-1 / TIP-1 family domain-containing protein [Ditylenchus destructor]
MNIRTRLADLNSRDLHQYFRGFREIYQDLQTKKDAFEVDELVYQQTLREMMQNVEDIRNSFNATRMNVTCNMDDLIGKYADVTEELRKKDPPLLEKIENLLKMQRELAYFKFAKNFLQLRDEVRNCLRKRDFKKLAEQYEKLAKIPDSSEEFSTACSKEYAIRKSTLDRFLIAELKSSLLEVYARLRFPFEEAVDYVSLRPHLGKTVEIMKSIHLIQSHSDENYGLSVMEIIYEEFGKRFKYHFYGDKPTNSPSKPEWFFTQLSVWIANNIEYFEEYVQEFINQVGMSDVNARSLFIQYIVDLAAKKVKSLVKQSNFVQDRRMLSHLIDETVIFEKEITELYDYGADETTHVISALSEDNILDTWIKLERDTISIGVDAILADPDAYESRYKGAADVDPYLVPNFADSFVILMQSMYERYKSIPDIRLQCRFVKLQLIIVDEFRSRIVQINQQIDTPWRSPYPQLMNALWYVTLVLDDWSDLPEFVRLQYYLQASSSSLVKGIFDESSSFYRHVWRQRAKQLSDSFAEHIRHKLNSYINEKWYAHDVAKPIDVTSSFAAFLTEINRLLCSINKNISPDSILTIYHLTNHEIWQVLDLHLISRTPFNYRGAAQMKFDITTALIPLLNSLYHRPKATGDFDVILDEKCVRVLNTLKLLSLPTPTAILLKEEMEHIPEQNLDDKLEPFGIVSLTKSRVLEIFEQRCDMTMQNYGSANDCKRNGTYRNDCIYLMLLYNRGIKESTSTVEKSTDGASESTTTAKVSQRTQEKIERSGIAFLLQQMRNSEAVNSKTKTQPILDEADSNIETNNTRSSETIKNVAPKEPTKIDYKFQNVLSNAPMQRITDCYNQGTVPDFGFSSKVNDNNYVRSCKWSPSGHWLITESMDRRVRIFKYDSETKQTILHSGTRTGDLIYELQWHPTEDWFASTSKSQPIHIWDENGKLKLSFRGINNMDELTSAYSISFSLDGQTLYGGYYKKLKIFDMERPGRQIKEIKTFEKGSIGGQKSIMSCIAMCPTFAGSYAVGCFAGSIGLYSDQTGSCDCLFGTGSMGVTHLEYSSDGNLLFSGYRKSNIIECFDLRFPGHVLSRLYRPVDTNQRIYFQRDHYDRYLFSGSTGGEILVYDIKSGQSITSVKDQDAIQPKWKMSASLASVAGLSLHPELPIMAVTTGQRVFPNPLDTSDESESEMQPYTSLATNKLDNSLQLWQL